MKKLIGIGLTLAAGMAARAAATNEAVNLALFATPATSFVSGHETLAAINDGFEPRNVGDHSHGCYGNWPQSGRQWVQLEWSQPVTTHQVAVYWWDDTRGVRLPVASQLLFWNGKEFEPVKNASGLGVAGGRWRKSRHLAPRAKASPRGIGGSENIGGRIGTGSRHASRRGQLVPA